MPWVAEGLITGFIGYLTVALLFAVTDVGAGEGLFHTPAVLGSALFFGGGEGVGAVEGPGPIIAYNGLHLLVSLFIGLGASWLILQAERNRPLWYGVFFIFLAGFIYSVVLVGVLAAEIAHVLPWGAVVLANALAGATAGGYLWWRHTQLWRELEVASGQE